MTLNVAVIESRWWKTGNASVQGLFELIGTVHGVESQDYHYEMFNNEASLREIIRRVSRKSHVKNLYIAAHGNSRSLFGAEGMNANRVSRDQLGDLLGSIRANDLEGLYLSTCLLGNDPTIQHLLNAGRISWIAGYSKAIGWLEGACLDMYFWDCYCRTNNHGGPKNRIKRVARRMREGVHPLCIRLGFNIFIRGNDGIGEPLICVQ